MESPRHSAWKAGFCVNLGRADLVLEIDVNEDHPPSQQQ